MAHDALSPGDVVSPDERARVDRVSAAQKNYWRPPGQESLDVIRADIDRRQQYAFNPVFLQNREGSALLSAVFVARREQHAVASAAKRCLRCPDQARIERVGAVGHDQTDKPRATAQERAREEVRHVAELSCKR